MRSAITEAWAAKERERLEKQLEEARGAVADTQVAEIKARLAGFMQTKVYASFGK